MIATVEEYAPSLGTSAACAALAGSRAILFRQRRPAARVARKRRVPRPLSDAERTFVLATLNAPDNVDKSPWSVYATLLSQDIHLCSVRTIYRILAASQQVRERRAQARHPKWILATLLSRMVSYLGKAGVRGAGNKAARDRDGCATSYFAGLLG